MKLVALVREPFRWRRRGVGFRNSRTVDGSTTYHLHGGRIETDESGAVTVSDVDGATR